MKLTTLLILVATLPVAASTSAQKITYTGRSVPLPKLFSVIKQQTGFVFFYDKKDLRDSKPVSVNFKETPLNTTLEEILSGQPLEFDIQGNTIVITRKEEKKEAEKAPTEPKETSPPDFITVTGVVKDSTGAPLSGASIRIKGKKKGAKTNAKGEFTLDANPGDLLTISFVGFEDQELRAKEGSLLVVLKTSNSPLDAVQIIAYGQTSKRLSTGNVSTVKAADIEKQPVNNPLLALQGRVPGLLITQSSGLPGAAVTVRIQGENSIFSGNDPLYVIDGVPFLSQLLPSITTNNYGIIANGSPLNFINPADIESIDVLKDADATAIYGSRAANGAILITTKKGRNGKMVGDVNVKTGYGAVTRKMNLLNKEQYLAMRHEAKNNDGLPVYPTDYDINGFWDTTRYTDWQKTLLGNTAHYTDVNGSLSGGNANTQYLVGTGYHQESTVFPGNANAKKNSIHFSLTTSSPDQKFRLQASGSYLSDKTLLPNEDLTWSALNLPPTAPAVFNPDGSLNWAQDANGNSTFINNPLRFMNKRYQLNTTNLLGNAVLSYRILPGLDIKTSVGFNNLQSIGTITVPSLSSQPEYREIYNLRSVSYSNSTITQWNLEPQITYSRKIQKGKLEALMGATMLQTKSNQFQLYGSGYTSDASLEDLHSATNLTVVSTLMSIYRYSAAFSRIKYSYDDKYIINLNGRRDGSSRFGVKNQFHNFGSVGLAWIFSSENFCKENLSLLSFGKLRASYGTTGNDQIGDYQFLDLYSLGSQVARPYQGVMGLTPAGIYNPYLAWESTRKLQFGLDIGFARDKLLFSVNYNRNRSSNQLVLYNIPIFTGFGGFMNNFPATVQNSGWELSGTAKIISTKQFSWSGSINLTISNNKLIAFPDLATSSYSKTYEIGKPITSIRLYKYAGVDPATGVYQFKDAKGALTSFPNFEEDMTVLAKTYPDFYGGFQHSFSYRGIALDILFQFVKQKGLNFPSGAGNPGEFLLNMPVTVLGRWQKPGDKADIQKFNSDDAIFSPIASAMGSDKHWSDASYIRLKNLSLSWQLPPLWIKRLQVNDCRLYIQAQNLLTLTKYIGPDPETQSYSSLPPLKIVTIGLKLAL